MLIGRIYHGATGGEIEKVGLEEGFLGGMIGVPSVDFEFLSESFDVVF